MMQPMNYTINAPDVAGAFTRGAEQVAQFQNNQAVVLANQQKAEAQRMANERAAYQQQRFREVAQNPTSTATQKLLLEFPEIAEQTERALKSISESEKQTAMQVKYMVRSAIKEGKPEIAVQELDRMIEAAKNSGNASMLQKLEIERDGLIANPNGARLAAESLLFSAMGKDYASMVSEEGDEERKQELRPATLKEAESKAEKAAVSAKFAESQEAMELQTKGWQIKKLANDIQISKQNVAIAAQNAAINRADSATKRQEAEIKLQELLDKRSNTVREKVAEVESARTNMDNMLNTADRILNTPMGVVGAAAGPISSRMPTMSQSTADFEALVETLGSQSFLAQIPNIKGMGALSNAEGEKLQAALQNFNLKQSPERLLENVREAQRLILKGRQNIAKRFGVPESVPDTPAAAGSGDIEALLKKYGQQ
jgi:hypothetical protein